jgi:hypothetical protein
MASNIHPVWMIDEYVKIFRNDVWFIPPSAPMTTDIRIIVRDCMRYGIIIMSAVFCTAIINKHFAHLRTSVTLGTINSFP